ncbi:hypothetical protein BH10PSE7_BH10PSE7_35850 [soil metagenome]
MGIAASIERDQRSTALAADSGRETADLALRVLTRLNRAVAVVDPKKRVRLANLRFQELFKDGGDILSLLGAGPRTRLGSYQHKLPDGRTLSVECTPVPEGHLIFAEDISRQVADRDQRDMNARTDPLTGLGNRFMFEGELNNLLVQPERVRTSAVLIVELDGFDAIQDTLGHTLGESLLKRVADRIQSAVSPIDLTARLAGARFGIIQTGRAQPEESNALARRLVDLVGRSYLIEGHILNLGARAGIAIAAADAKGDQLVKQATLALYRAREEEPGSYRFFECDMDKRMEERRSLETDLRSALALRELSLHYQPQFNIASQCITGFEALLRWNNLKRGFVSPAVLIPLAEEIGLIRPIGEWVIRSACREAAKWPKPLSVAVNVSGLQFASPTLVSTIVDSLAEYQLDPERLELEITESVLLDDQGVVLESLRILRDMGVRVAMDDFGTGYSSLSYLRSFPLNKIKIDQSFVRGKSGDPSGKAIIRAIAGIGHSLGMSTTAEGVETEEQLACVTSEGCTDIQGYLISKPMMPQNIAEFLDTHDHRKEDHFHNA